VKFWWHISDPSAKSASLIKTVFDLKVQIKKKLAILFPIQLK
jgi:hypothetical protein